MPNLRAALDDLTRHFTASVLDVLRTASIDELLSPHGPAATTGSRPRTEGTTRAGRRTTGRSSSRRSGRLRRRSDEQIAKDLDRVLALVKMAPQGMRAEELRVGLGVQAKELPRILKAGLVSKKLKTKGQKRQTTYFAV